MTAINWLRNTKILQIAQDNYKLVNYGVLEKSGTRESTRKYYIYPFIQCLYHFSPVRKTNM